LKKKLLLLLSIGFIVISCNKNTLYDSHWIAVKSYPIPPETGNSIYDGITINFTKDKLIIGDVYDERNSDFNLKITGKKVFLNDTLWALIFAKYEDSLILDIGQDSRVKFIKLDQKNSIVEKSKLWNHRNWILSNNNFRRELFLTDSLFFDQPNTKLCIQKDLDNNQFISTVDKWKAININGNQLFVMTFNQMHDELYRVKSYVGDSIIKLESLKSPKTEQVFLKKRPYLSEKKRRQILGKIQNREWETVQIIQIDTLGRGSGYWDDNLINQESLKNKNLSFKFSSNLTYDIYESGNSIENGTWELSLTGNEIILNFGLSPYDYLDLIKVSSDLLEIGNLKRFEPDNHNYGLAIELYYKIKLK